MDLSNYPKTTIKILDIGAGLGTLSFYFYKLFKGNCEIDNIEKNKQMNKLGAKYFGFQNYDNRNKVQWFYEDCIETLNKMAKYNELNNPKPKKNYSNKLEHYDLIFNEINDINPKDECVPQKIYFEDEYLNNVKSLLKPYGIYAVNLMGANYSILYECYLQLEKHFPSIFHITSEGRLSYIFFCFKGKIENKKYEERYKINEEIVKKNESTDYNIISLFINDVLSRVQDMTDEKKKMEENSKIY